MHLRRGIIALHIVNILRVTVDIIYRIVQHHRPAGLVRPSVPVH